MEEILYLMKRVKEEANDAHDYAQEAIEAKTVFPDLASTYYKLSAEELGHMEALHKCVVSMIEEHRDKEGAVPADTMVLYKYLHKEAMEIAEKAGVLRELYKAM